MYFTWCLLCILFSQVRQQEQSSGFQEGIAHAQRVHVPLLDACGLALCFTQDAEAASSSKHSRSKDSKHATDAAKRGRLGTRTTSVDEKEKPMDRSKSREPSKGAPARARAATEVSVPQGSKLRSSVLSRPPAGATGSSVVSSSTYAVPLQAAPMEASSGGGLRRISEDPLEVASQRAAKLRDEADVIPVAASAHIHAAAARAVAGGGPGDEAEFDIVEHYVSTRPTSGIRPRSGVRTTAVNPALVAIRGAGSGLAVSVPPQSNSGSSKRSPVVTSKLHDEDDRKLQDDESPNPYSDMVPLHRGVPVASSMAMASGGASHSRSRRTGLPTMGQPTPSSLFPVPLAVQAGREEAAERQAKLATERDEPPPSQSRMPVRDSLFVDDCYCSLALMFAVCD